MTKMRKFIFISPEETKEVEAVSYKKAVKSFQGSTKLKTVKVQWEAKKGGMYEMDQLLPMGRKKKLAR